MERPIPPSVRGSARPESDESGKWRMAKQVWYEKKKMTGRWADNMRRGIKVSELASQRQMTQGGKGEKEGHEVAPAAAKGKVPMQIHGEAEGALGKTRSGSTKTRHGPETERRPSLTGSKQQRQYRQRRGRNRYEDKDMAQKSGEEKT